VPLSIILTQPILAYLHPAGPHPTGTGYCFPRWNGPNIVLPRLSCPTGYQLSHIGKCVRKTHRTTESCFKGPACMAPYNATGAPTCFDDKVMEVITGVMALKKVCGWVFGLPGPCTLQLRAHSWAD
jgi:hypothetical protein